MERPSTKERNLFMGIILLILASLMQVTAKETMDITFVGEVTRPSRVTVAPEDTFESTLKAAGGSNVWANPRRFIRIRVSEVVDGGIPKTTHESQEFLIERGGKPSLSKLGIKNGDIIYICRKRPM